MSTWTHIVAAIDVDTYILDFNIKEVVQDLLINAPKITGSERDADIFVNVVSGYNSAVYSDCNICAYKSFMYEDDNGISCDADSNFKCPDSKYQTRVVITVVGDLRDRFKQQTHKEWNKFNNFVAKKIRGKKGFEIRNCSCRIQGW